MIVIPAICVGVLIIAAITVTIRLCNKKRERNPVEIKQKVVSDTDRMAEIDAQYVMDPDEKNNIFARPVNTPASKKRRARIGVKEN